MSNYTNQREAKIAVDPQLERGLRVVLGLGLALVLFLPVARGYSDWLGWMPLWLVGMPAVALWSLHRFRSVSYTHLDVYKRQVPRPRAGWPMSNGIRARKAASCPMAVTN